MRGIKTALWVLFTIFVILVAVALVNQNSDPIKIALFNYVTKELPLYLILIITFILGALFSTLFFVVELIVLESRCLRLKRLNSKLERAILKDPANVGNQLPQSEIVVSSADTSDV